MCPAIEIMREVTIYLYLGINDYIITQYMGTYLRSFRTGGKTCM